MQRVSGSSGISAVVLTFNEARHLPDCLATLHWADEVLVLDSGSADGTVALARAAGARVEQRPFTHFGAQREAALRLAAHPWVFFVDADERVPPPLAAEIQAVVHPSTVAPTEAPPHTPHPTLHTPHGWWIPRRNFFWGREVRHSGWAPDFQLRLLRRDAARYDPSQRVHEVAQVDGPTGRLRHALLHINYDSWGEFWAKQRSYARHEGAKLRAQGLRWKPWNLLLQPPRAFRRRFWEWQGWRDGLLGLQLALAMAWWEGAAYLELRRLERQQPGSPSERL